ncbi:hypothetical protein CPB84DRAFT_934219 [Gymnopilus junonius]|uniref:Nephrocystin 3-like N-terminal domain-containing protein n=1 Tax=Gymnopilus junonius TaxID=109634 RepID=A0A9P5TT22_GYMJU|nr:hypothetical protein CPB84DRAFT_934219 [Gymnopilus junonius]
MLLGTVNGVRKIIADPDTRNTNKLTVACCKALNGAFLPYQTLSARKLGKKGERHTAIVKDMLCGAIRALEAIERALRISTSYHYEKHHLEQKQIAWTCYFEFCEQFLLQGGIDQKIEPPVNTTVRRTQCPYQMTANNDLPMNSKVLPMDLPVTYTSGTYDRPDLVRLIGEWIFSPSFSNSSAFDLNQKSHKVFCLSGPAGCGKTQLASRMIDWLREMKCLGGYFSFDRVTGQTPRQLLDALPITLIHQACTVQPDIAQRISRSYSSNLEAAHTTLEDFFDQFFAEPVLKFEEERGNRGWRLWNPVDQLVFVIDGLGSQTRSSASRFHGGVTSGPEQAEQEEARMLQDFVNFFTSNAILKLPSYFKFLILCRSSTSIHKMFKEKGIGYVHEMTPIVQYVESQSSFTSSSKSGYGSLSTSSSGSGIGSPAPSISIQAF